MREAIASAGIDANIDVVQDGHSATQRIDGADANEQIPCPDLILLDMNLPKKSGDEVLHHLRASVRCRNTRVLIVSSSDAPRDRAAVETFAVSGYFKKPSNYVEFMKLGPMVRELLESGTLPDKTG